MIITYTINIKIIDFFKGGEPTKDEMCAHIFTYYPRMDDDLTVCFNRNTFESLQDKMNSS